MMSNLVQMSVPHYFGDAGVSVAVRSGCLWMQVCSVHSLSPGPLVD